MTAVATPVSKHGGLQPPLLVRLLCILLTSTQFVTPLFGQAGSIDPSFNPSTGADGTVWATAVQPDGKILIGGSFINYNGTPINRIARLNSDGSLDGNFNPGLGPNNTVRALVVQADGKILIGGLFTFYNNSGQKYIARLNSDGSLDASFNQGGTGANNTIATMALQSDGRIMIGGDLTTYNGTSRNGIARLNSDGSLDASFDPGTGTSGSPNRTVRTVALQGDKILIGGLFTSYNGIEQRYIARLNSNGSLDIGFNSGTGTNTFVYAIAVQCNGKILIGGNMIRYKGTAIKKIARLNYDGSLDYSFNQNFGIETGIVYTIAIQTDGKILIGGSFTSYTGYDNTPRSRIARLYMDGSLDASFNPGAGANNTVQVLTLQPDGRILVGGDFTTYDDIIRNKITRVNGLTLLNQNVVLDENCSFTVPDFTTGIVASSNCGTTTVTQTPAPGTLTSSGHGQTLGVFVTADDGRGYSTEYKVVLTAVDVTKPSFRAPSDQTIALGVNCAIVIPDFITGLTGKDNCGTVAFTQSPVAGWSESSSNNQKYNVVITASDGNGNSQEETFVLTAIDNTKPVLTVPANTTLNCDASAEPSNTGTATATDNCSATPIVTYHDKSTRGSDPAASNYYNYNITRTWKAEDGSGNWTTADQTITVQDVTNPVAKARNIAITLGLYGTVSITAGDVNDGSYDNCSPVILTIDKSTFNNSDVTSAETPAREVILTVTDVSGNKSTAKAYVTVNRRVTTIVYNGDGQEQYSDLQDLQATLTDAATGTPLSGKSVSFKIATQAAVNATTSSVAPLGIAKSSQIVSLAPGSYSIISSFDGDGTFLPSSKTDKFTVLQEDADVTYTGNTYFTLPNPNATAMNVPVTDLVKDISTVALSNDVFKGDISKAEITFSIGTANPLTVPVILLNSADLSTGTANASYNVSLTSTELSSGGKSITVNSKAGAYYQNSTGAIIPAVVTVATQGTGFVSGGGFILTSTPAGVFAPAVGDRTNFGFSMQYTKSRSNLKGQCNIILRANGNIYQIKSNATNTLSIDNTGLKGYFNTKATISDITDPLNTKQAYDQNGNIIPGGLDLTVWINDVSQGGTGDQVAIQLFNGSRLLYASNWIDGKTTLQNLNGGNISVRAGTAAAPPIASPTVTGNVLMEQDTKLSAIVYPNPATSQFVIKLNSSNLREQITVRIFNQQGQTIEVKRELYAGQSFQTGSSFRQGTYVMEIVQGKEKAILKLVKTSE